MFRSSAGSLVTSQIQAESVVSHPISVTTLLIPTKISTHTLSLPVDLPPIPYSCTLPLPMLFSIFELH